MPEGLDLDKWINEPPKEEELPKAKDLFSWDDLAADHVKSPLEDEPDSEAMQAKRAQRKLAQQANPFFLGSMFVVGVGSVFFSAVNINRSHGVIGLQ